MSHLVFHLSMLWWERGRLLIGAIFPGPYRTVATVYSMIMLAAEGYEERMATCQAHLASLQALEAIRYTEAQRRVATKKVSLKLK